MQNSFFSNIGLDLGRAMRGSMSFRGNDGHYTRISKSVTIRVAGGLSRGSFPIYLHNGDEYIKLNQTWICIQGKQYFWHNSNQYVVIR